MRTFAKMLAVGLCSVFLAGTSALAQAVTVDYDHSINFLKFKTYTLQKVHATDPGVESRLSIAVDRNLQTRYLHSDSSNPDLIVAVVEASQDKQEYTTFYDSLGGLSWQRGWGSGNFMDGTATVQDIPVGTLVFDIWDAKTKKLIWRGTILEPASVTGNKEADQKLDKAVGQVLAQYPPKFKKS
jgi:Domain of unknown function (DUF4136)